MTQDNDIEAAEQLSREAETLLAEYFRIRREYNALDKSNPQHAVRRSALKERYFELDQRYSTLVKAQDGIVERAQGSTPNRADVLWRGALEQEKPSKPEFIDEDVQWIEISTPVEGEATDELFEQALREVARDAPTPVETDDSNDFGFGTPVQDDTDKPNSIEAEDAVEQPAPVIDALRELTMHLQSGELDDIELEPDAHPERESSGPTVREDSARRVESISKALLATKPTEKAPKAVSPKTAGPEVRPVPCPSCGEVLPAGTEACSFCGARLIAGDTAEGIADRVPPHLQLKPPKKKEKTNLGPKIVITIGWLFVLIAATWLITQGFGVYSEEVRTWLDERKLEFLRPEEGGRILGVSVILLGGTLVGLGVFAGHFVRVVVSLHELARTGRVDMIEKLIMRGEEIDARDERGCTPLHFAVVAGQREAVAVLVGNGADLNSHNERGDTPLHMAVANRDHALVQYLINKGADAEAVNESGSTLMHVASWVGDVGLIKLLIERGLQVDAKTRVGFTPLHFAAQSGHDEAIEFLLEHGADPNATSEHGTTPVFPAVRNGHLNAVRLLIEGGADYDVRRGHDFESPLGIARLHNRREIYDYLESLGATD